MSARTYQIDKSHSEATFQVRHLLTKVRGHFSDFDGTITSTRLQPAASAVRVSVQAASIDTNEPNRDTHLRSDRLLRGRGVSDAGLHQRADRAGWRRALRRSRAT